MAAYIKLLLLTKSANPTRKELEARSSGAPDEVGRPGVEFAMIDVVPSLAERDFGCDLASQRGAKLRRR